MALGDRLTEHIRVNALKSVLLIAGFPFVLPLISFVFVLVALSALSHPGAAGVASGVFVFVLVAVGIATLVWLPIGYLLCQWIIDQATGARLLTRAEEPRLWAIYENLCKKCDMRLPALRVIETDVLNAFASGLRDGEYSVTVTRGLLKTLHDDELEAVLAHELTHIRNHDCRLLVVATILVGLVPIIHDVALRFFWMIVMGILNIYRAIFSLIPMPLVKGMVTVTYTLMLWAGKGVAFLIGTAGHICSLVIHFSLSRKREFMADAGAVEITGNPEALISALRKVSSDSEVVTKIEGVREMLFDSPRLNGLFATHPPIEQRIEAIRQYSMEVRRGPDNPSAGAPSASAAAEAGAPAVEDASMIGGYCQALLRAMDGRPASVDRKRRIAIYRRAHRALLDRLHGFDPPLPADEIRRLEGALEAAVEEIEYRALTESADRRLSA